MKRRSLLQAVLALSLGALSAGIAAQTVLKFSHTDQPGGARQKAAELFGQKIEQYTQGRYKLQIYPAGQLANDLPVGGAEVGVGLQPARPALLVPPQRELGAVGAVGLLAGHRHHPRVDAGRPGPPPQAKHPSALTLRLLLGGELLKGLVGLGSAVAGPRQLPRPIPRCLVEQAAEPVTFGAQLGGGQPA